MKEYFKKMLQMGLTLISKVGFGVPNVFGKPTESENNENKDSKTNCYTATLLINAIYLTELSNKNQIVFEHRINYVNALMD